MSAELLEALQSGGGATPLPAGSSVVASASEGQTPKIPDTLSILPLRGFVIFPGTVAPLDVHRLSSIKLLDETLPQSKIIGLIAQRDETKEEPGPQDLYEVGTAAIVLKFLRQSDDHAIALVQGLSRFSLRKIVSTDPYLRAEIDLLSPVPAPQTKEFEAEFRNVRASAARLLELTPDAPEGAASIVHRKLYVGNERCARSTVAIAPEPKRHETTRNG
jgi:ATP-dependent Lon protease